MNFIDLTHKISNDMPVYPGTDLPEIIDQFTIDKDGYAEKFLKMVTHTGTHLDAPAHIIKGGLTLNDLDIDYFSGNGLVIDVSNIIDRNILIDNLKKHENELIKSDFIIFYTGWSRYWGYDKYFEKFPVLSESAAKWLIEKNIKGIGLDAVSVDPVGADYFSNHHIFLGNNIVIIENLANVDKLLGKNFIFYCFPLRISDGDGSPIRAVASIF